jgi:hypothetical protein
MARALLLQMGSEEVLLMYIPPQPVNVQFGESQIQFAEQSNPTSQHMPTHGGARALDMSPGKGVTRRQESLRLVSNDMEHAIRLPTAPSITALVGVGLPKKMKIAFNRLSKVVDGEMVTLAPAWRMILSLKKEHPQHALDDLVEAYEDLYLETGRDAGKAKELYSELGELCHLYPGFNPAEVSKLYAGLYQSHAGKMDQATMGLDFLLMRGDEYLDVPLILLGMLYTGLNDFDSLSSQDVFKGIDSLLDSHRCFPQIPLLDLALSFESFMQTANGNVSFAQELLHASLKREATQP